MTSSKIVRLFLLLSIALIPLGQFQRLNLGNGIVFTPLDVTVFCLFYLWFVSSRSEIKKLLRDKTFFWWLLFVVWAIVSLVFSLNFFTPGEILVGSLFLLRWVFYSGVLFAVSTTKIGETALWSDLLLASGLVVAILGFAQFWLFRDLSFLAPFGWDPHQGRIVSTFLDPNFVGGFFVLLWVLSSTSLANSKNYPSKKLFYLASTVILFLATVLTFSRSAYIALAVAFILLSILRFRIVYVFVAASFVLFLLLIPKVSERISGALSFDETSQARVASWGNALKIAQGNLIYGVGFNNYRYAQIKSGFITQEEAAEHASSGTDSSILLILATSGILGLLLFLSFLVSLAKVTYQSKGKLALAGFVASVALLVHSEFVNSLFYPPIVLTWSIMIGLAVKKSFKDYSQHSN